MRFPYLTKLQANRVANGVFLILLGLLYYTNAWWPGLVFAIGLTYALRRYLMGRRLEFFLSLAFMGMIGLIILIGVLLSSFFPFIFIAIGLYLILKGSSFPGIIRVYQKTSRPSE